MRFKKRYILLILVVLVLFSDTVGMLCNRITFSSVERDHLKELKNLSADDILSDMSECRHPDDYYDLHLYALRKKRKDETAEFWYNASLNDEYSMTARRAALQMYADKVGLSLESRRLLYETPSEKIAEFYKSALYFIITSGAKMETEWDIMERISPTDEGAEYLEAFFYVTDVDEYYSDALSWLRGGNLYRRYEVTEKVLSDHESYLPGQVAAALSYRSFQLGKNEPDYTAEELFAEREAFTDLCIEIIESDLYRTDEAGDFDITDPVYMAADSLSEIYCEKAVRYLFLNEEMILERFGEDRGFYILFGAVNDNEEMFSKLSQLSQKQEDVELLVKSLKYHPLKDVNDNLKKTLSLDEYKGKYEIKYPDDHDGTFAYTDLIKEVIYSWTFD
ncbi:MAG: hypothetical protein IKM61_07650 [Eubacteriaceae bacterium]|nr:hypothetical protein [Eubacteriaceae bacterium]